MIRRIAPALFVMLCFCLPVHSQNSPNVDLGLGYSHIFSIPFGGHENGGEASVDFNVLPKLRLTADYGLYFSGNSTAHLIMAGPQFRSGPMFFHTLAGVQIVSASATIFNISISATATAFSSAFGGGFEWRRNSRLGIRVGADYLLGIAGGQVGSSLRTSGGVVYHFGKHENNSTRSAPVPPPTVLASSAADIAALGVSGYSTEMGFRLTAVSPSSRAAQISLRPGDIIISIDGREVHDSREINMIISANSTGKLRLELLIQTSSTGLAHAEREIQLR